MIVYVLWEGRGYGTDSLVADLQRIEEIFGKDVTLYSAAFDVGMLVTDSVTPPSWTAVKETRHGQIDAEPTDWTKPQEEEDEPLVGPHGPTIDWDGEWAQHRDLGNMIWDWMKAERIYRG